MILGALSLFVGDTSFLIGSIVLGAFIGWLYGRWVDSSVWNRTPYWLRGGVIGGGIALICYLLVYGCFNYIGFLLGSGAEEIVLQCFILYVVGPIFPTGWFIVLAGSLFGDYGLFAEVYSPILSIPAWFIMGSLVGMVIGLFKNKKSPPLK